MQSSPPVPRPLSFPKSARLLSRPEFLAAKERGRSIAEGPLAASWLPRPDRALPTRPAAATAERPEIVPALARVGLTVSSKVGGAVVRNRVKRALREAVRRELHTLPCVDLVLVARASSVDAGVPVLREWIRRAARRIHSALEAKR